MATVTAGLKWAPETWVGLGLRLFRFRCLGLVEGLGLRVWGFRVKGLGFRAWGLRA